MIQEIAKFIESRTSFVVGTTLRVGRRIQGAPDRCQVVLESAGGATYFDLPDRGDVLIQVISRAKSQMNARDDAWEVYKAIHGTAGWDLPVISSGVFYVAMTIEAVATPQYIGQDDKRRFEFSTNYIFRIRDA